MPLIDSSEITLIIPKAIHTMLFILNIYLINKKYRGIIWKNRPLFHRFFFTGMASWTIYIFLDIFIYLIAGLSMDPSIEYGTYSGYDTAFPSLIIANILRDVGFFAASIMCWSYLIAAFSLRYEEDKVNRIFLKNKYTLVIMALISTIIMVGDIIELRYSEDMGVNVSAQYNGFGLFSIFLNVLIYFICILILYKTIRNVTSEESSKSFKKRIRNFMYGIILMGFGHLYWIILGVLTLTGSSILQVFPYIVYFIIGHLIWTISPVLMYFGFAGDKVSPKEDQ